VAGKPLLEYTLDAIRNADVTSHVVVSTDAKAISSVAERCGTQVVWRPAELSGDNVSTEAVLLHAIRELDPEGQRFRWVMTLAPTSPFRKPDTIRRFVAEAEKDPLSKDCIMSVTEDYRDFWSRGEKGFLKRLFPDAPRRQQDRQPLLEENGLIYLTPVTEIKETGFVFGKRVRGILTDAAESFDINTLSDFEMAEAMMKIHSGQKDDGVGLKSA
jgi:CMP-N-acetylneuraminic acid synthetase